MKQLVIFDLDGTLLNTIDDLGMATNYALKKCGYPTHSIGSYPLMVGNGVSKLIERALPDDARSRANVDRLRAFFTEYYDFHCMDATVPYPGIRELLEELTTRQVRLAVASNKYQAAVEKLINNYFPEFPWAAVEGQKPDVPVKPDP